MQIILDGDRKISDLEPCLYLKGWDCIVVISNYFEVVYDLTWRQPDRVISIAKKDLLDIGRVAVSIFNSMNDSLRKEQDSIVHGKPSVVYLVNLKGD